MNKKLIDENGLEENDNESLIWAKIIRLGLVSIKDDAEIDHLYSVTRAYYELFGL